MINRRNIEGLAGLCAILCCLIGLVLGGCSTSESKGMDIYPEKALIIFTQENWGCLVGQKLKEDVTAPMAKDDGQFARLDEIKNPTDVDNRYELFLSFPAKEIDGLPGYYILKLGIAHEQPMEEGYLLIDQAKIVDSENGYSFRLKAKTKGMLRADLLYGKHPQLKVGLFSCTEAGLFEPEETSFFSAYEIEPDLGVKSKKLNKEWDEVDIPIDSFLLEKGRFIDECEGLLDALNNEFSASEDFAFLWDKSKVTTKDIKQIASKVERGKELKFDVSVKMRYKDKSVEVNSNGGGLFVPELRQKVSLKESNGQLTGGEVWVGIAP